MRARSTSASTRAAPGSGSPACSLERTTRRNWTAATAIRCCLRVTAVAISWISPIPEGPTRLPRAAAEHLAFRQRLAVLELSEPGSRIPAGDRVWRVLLRRDCLNQWTVMEERHARVIELRNEREVVAGSHFVGLHHSYRRED